VKKFAEFLALWLLNGFSKFFALFIFAITFRFFKLAPKTFRIWKLDQFGGFYLQYFENNAQVHSKNHVAEFTFLVRRINVNCHTPSAYVFLLWFHDSDHWIYVSGVFYLKNNFLARPRFKLATARNTFQHKNTKPQPSVIGYSTSWKLNNQLPISIIFWIWSISKDVGSMFWLT
jgi:hypothetical protein